MMMYHSCCFYRAKTIPTYTIECLECFLKVMTEDNTVKFTILISLENKKIWKIKKAPARTIKFSKKDDKLMIFFKAP